MNSLILGGRSVSAKAHTVAVLTSSDITPYNQAIQSFGKNLPNGSTLVHKENLKGNLANGPRIAQRILDSQADLLLAVGLKAALVAKMEIPDIPVIYCMVLNPMKFDLQAPHMTGIALEIPFEEQVLPLRMIMPTLNRIGVLYNPQKTEELVRKARHQAKRAGLELVVQAVTSQKDVPAALREMIPQVQALWLLPDSTVLNEDSIEFLLRATLEKNVPVVGFSSGLVKKGALVSAYISYEDIGKQAAELSTTILAQELSGTPGELLPPNRLRLAINLKTVNFLGLSISPDILNRFDKLF